MNFRDVLGALLVGAFIIIIGGLFWQAIPKDNEQLLTYMIGQLSGFVSAVVALHYVTKAGEKELEQQRAENTGKALDAIKTAQESPASLHPDVVLKPGETAQAEEAKGN